MKYSPHKDRTKAYWSKNFKPVVAFDWLQLQIELKHAMSSRTFAELITPVLGQTPAFKTVDGVFKAGTGISAIIFKVQFQDPKSQAHVESVISKLKSTFDLKTAPTFTASEIFFQLVRRDGTTTQQLADAVVHLYNFDAWQPKDQDGKPNRNHRLYSKLTVEEPMTGAAPLARAVTGGHSLAIGSQRSTWAKADPESSRYYLKVTDARQTLPDNKHSARVERTLQGAAQPFKDAQGLADFMRADNPALCALFGFRRLRDDLNQWAACAAQSSVLAIYSGHTRTVGTGTTRSTREHSPLTRADSELNAMVARALKSFAKRWQEQPVCGNSDNLPTLTDGAGTAEECGVLPLGEDLAEGLESSSSDGSALITTLSTTPTTTTPTTHSSTTTPTPTTPTTPLSTTTQQPEQDDLYTVEDLIALDAEGEADAGSEPDSHTEALVLSAVGSTLEKFAAEARNIRVGAPKVRDEVCTVVREGLGVYILAGRLRRQRRYLSFMAQAP
jgi:hypothetical protein